MRITLAQLRKFAMPYKCSELLDVKEDLSGFEDIISTSAVNVCYEIKERGLDTYLVCFNFELDLIMQCSISLQEVPYKIKAYAEEVFSTDEELEEAFVIEGQTLDTKEAVLTNIFINKPMKVVAPGVTFDEEVEDDEEDDSINPAFAKLKDLL